MSVCGGAPARSPQKRGQGGGGRKRGGGRAPGENTTACERAPPRARAGGGGEKPARRAWPCRRCEEFAIFAVLNLQEEKGKVGRWGSAEVGSSRTGSSRDYLAPNSGGGAARNAPRAGAAGSWLLSFGQSLVFIADEFVAGPFWVVLLNGSVGPFPRSAAVPAPPVMISCVERVDRGCDDTREGAMPKHPPHFPARHLRDFPAPAAPRHDGRRRGLGLLQGALLRAGEGRRLVRRRVQAHAKDKLHTLEDFSARTRGSGHRHGLRAAWSTLLAWWAGGVTCGRRRPTTSSSGRRNGARRPPSRAVAATATMRASRGGLDLFESAASSAR